MNRLYQRLKDLHFSKNLHSNKSLWMEHRSSIQCFQSYFTYGATEVNQPPPPESTLPPEVTVSPSPLPPAFLGGGGGITSASVLTSAENKTTLRETQPITSSPLLITNQVESGLRPTASCLSPRKAKPSTGYITPGPERIFTECTSMAINGPGVGVTAISVARKG